MRNIVFNGFDFDSGISQAIKAYGLVVNGDIVGWVQSAKGSGLDERSRLLHMTSLLLRITFVPITRHGQLLNVPIASQWLLCMGIVIQRLPMRLPKFLTKLWINWLLLKLSKRL